MTQEYIIVSKTAIEERIKELEWNLENIPESYITKHVAQIYALKQILSQSTPLIPEIEKAFNEGNDLNATIITRQNYISNLKLNI